MEYQMIFGKLKINAFCKATETYTLALPVGMEISQGMME